MLIKAADRFLHQANIRSDRPNLLRMITLLCLVQAPQAATRFPSSPVFCSGGIARYTAAADVNRDGNLLDRDQRPVRPWRAHRSSQQRRRQIYRPEWIADSSGSATQFTSTGARRHSPPRSSAPGTHTITASYWGKYLFNPHVSAPITERVSQ